MLRWGVAGYPVAAAVPDDLAHGAAGQPRGATGGVVEVMATETRVFWIDTDYDRANASNGVSRYAAYVHQAADQFADDVDDYDDPSVPVAARAWSIARPPVMTPGYVANHPRVLSAQAWRDDFNGDLLVSVDLVSALPGPVARAAGWSWRSWQYSDWSERFDTPELRQGGRDKALLPTLTATVLVPAEALPITPGSRVPNWREAAATVSALCSVLNAELGPIVTALDGGGQR